MIKKVFFIGIFIFLLTAKYSPVTGAQYEKNVDYTKIQKDLRIMENILQTLLTDYIKDYLPIGRPETSGIYIEGYGVVFITSPTSDFLLHFAVLPPITKIYRDVKNRSQVIISQKSPDEEREREEDKQKEEILTETTDSIIEFLTDYAGAIKGLNPDNRITVVCKLSKEYRKTFEKMYDVKDSQMLLTAEKRWLNDYKKGLVGFEDLKKRIKNSSKGQYPQKDTYKRIDILKSIIESELENTYKRGISKSQIDGTYIRGLGTIFTIDLDRSGLFRTINIKLEEKFDDLIKSYKNIKYDELQQTLEKQALEKSKKAIEKTKEKLKESLKGIKEGIEKEIEIQSVPSIPPAPKIDFEDIEFSGKSKKDEKEEKSIEEKVKELTDVIAEVFADFGSTLKEMKDTERIEILIKSKELATKDRKVSCVQFSINKRDINDYDRNIINLDTFKNRININIY
ncbi:MAG: hypothetical protein HWN67_19690 [Candidatus Helarchaeota archaeon]|nr:hypothetical protein [Candidatus Helarchaeota archaeon]